MSKINCRFIYISLFAFTLFLTSFSVVQAEVIRNFETEDGTKIKVESLVNGLNHPWALTFLPDGRLLVSERNTGKLYILNQDNELSKEIPGVPKVWANGQGGLMDIALDPNFTSNKYVYLSYAKPGPGGKATTALGRGKFNKNKIENFKDIFIQEPFIQGPNHFGNRIEFSPDGKYLF